MPIFEYQCLRCDQIGSYVVLGSERRSAPPCASCGSKRTRRVMSSFAVHASEGARLDNFSTSGPRDDSFYQDSRNVGLWAKKRAQEMGVNLGAQFDETVEKARSGKLIKDLT